MMNRLKVAAIDGLVVGVKWAIVIAIIGFMLVMLSGDYLVTRQRSIAGQNALDFINQQIDAAKKQQTQAAPIPPAATTKK